MRATDCIVACSLPAASVLLWRRRLGSYHSQLLLSGRRKFLNATHGTATAMQLSRSWDLPLCFGSIAWFSSRLADRAGGKNVLATAMIFILRSHRRGTLCYGLYPWARLLPRSPPVEVHDLWPRLGSSTVPKQRWIASGMLAQWEHAMQSWIIPPLQIDSIRSNWKNKVFRDFFFNSIGSTCHLFPSPQFTNAFLVIHFLTNHMKLEVDS